jgi:ATP-dependent DNA helicase RecQ
MKTPAEPTPKRGRTVRGAGRGAAREAAPPIELSASAQRRYDALRAWRAEVAGEHNLPPYVVFNNATLAEMARREPANLAEMGEISGVGAKKLEAYGVEILRVLAHS